MPAGYSHSLFTFSVIVRRHIAVRVVISIAIGVLCTQPSWMCDSCFAMCEKGLGYCPNWRQQSPAALEIEGGHHPTMQNKEE